MNAYTQLVVATVVLSVAFALFLHVDEWWRRDGR